MNFGFTKYEVPIPDDGERVVTVSPAVYVVAKTIGAQRIKITRNKKSILYCLRKMITPPCSKCLCLFHIYLFFFVLNSLPLPLNGHRPVL